LSDFTLDRWRLGEASGADERGRVSVHLAACPRCQARLDSLQAVTAPALDFGSLAADPPPAPARPERRWRKRMLWLLPFAAGATLTALVPWSRPHEHNKGGGWQLGLVAQYANGKVSRVSPGDALAPGEYLRFEVSAPTDAFVSVISLDARGAVTPFVPAAGSATAIRAGKQRLLDGAVRLDDTTGPERIMLLACLRPVAVAEVVAAGRTALGRAQGQPSAVGQLDLPCAQTSFWIRKEVRP
jgi:anti-sigma factor RsiW